jgi:hypothetical protein
MSTRWQRNERVLAEARTNMWPAGHHHLGVSWASGLQWNTGEIDRQIAAGKYTAAQCLSRLMDGMPNHNWWTNPPNGPDGSTLATKWRASLAAPAEDIDQHVTALREHVAMQVARQLGLAVHDDHGRLARTTVPLDQQQLVAIHPPQSAAPPPPQQPSRLRTCIASLKLALRADITAKATGDPENMMESVLLFLESLQLIEVVLTDLDYPEKVKVELTQKKVAVLRRVDDLRGKLGTAEVHLNPRFMPDFRHLILSFAAAHAHCLHTCHVHDIVMYPCRSMRRGWPGKQIFYIM